MQEHRPPAASLAPPGSKYRGPSYSGGCAWQRAKGVVEGVEPAVRTLEGLYRGFLANLPLLLAGLVLLLVGTVVALAAAAGMRRAFRRTRADPVAADFSVRITRLPVVIATLLLALAVAGVEGGPALAGLGIAGLAVAFAVQGILENFIAGIILLIRHPFRAGDQIRTTDFEGTVADIDLRVTHPVTYAGGADPHPQP